jgi:hypothetical protein
LHEQVFEAVEHVAFGSQSAPVVHCTHLVAVPTVAHLGALLVHAVPHAPQLFGSVCVFTHAVPPQNVCPVPHAQLPLVHERPPLHAVPQAPQLFESVLVLTHCPEHAV